MPPALVALVRGIIEAAALTAIGAVITWASSADLGTLAPWAPIGLLALRQLEGIVDQKIDPSVQRVLGGAAK
jgi:hypothetical protein